MSAPCWRHIEVLVPQTPCGYYAHMHRTYQSMHAGGAYATWIYNASQARLFIAMPRQGEMYLYLQ